MIWAYLALNLCAIMAAAYVRYDASALRFAAPVAMGPAGWLWTVGAAGAACVGAALAGRKRVAGSAEVRRALAELMLLPAGAVLLLGFLPPKIPDYSPLHWSCIAALAAAMAGAVWRDRRSAVDLGLTGRNFRAAARWLALPTVIMVAAPIAATALVGTDFGCDAKAVSRAALSLAGYPFYALVQLLIFQVFLVPRLARLSDSAPAVIVAAAAMFALLHWPNALVMAACAAAAGVWTWVYLARPNVYALALSMTLAAVSFSQALPHDLTHHVRVGPIYVHRQVTRSPAPEK